MKKLTMIGMATLLLIAASCKKDKKTEIGNAGSGFRATVESHAGDSKTHLEDLAVKWDSGDAILVKSNTCTTPRGFTTQESGDNVNFDADATLPTNFYAPPYTGYYPASAFEGDQLTLPATQTYVAGSFGNGANPMAATSNETLLPFKNICGVLKLQLYNESGCNVDNITITSNTGEKLWGTGTVGFDTDNKPTLGALNGGSSRLTLNCSGMTMSTSSSSPSTFFFVVPASTLGTKFTVMVTFTGGKVWTKTADSNSNLIVRSQITKLPAQSVTPHEPVKPTEVTFTAGCVGCIYSVSGSFTLPSGNHECEYGLMYSETDDSPTIEEGAQKLVAGSAILSGTNDFTADITSLTEDVKYYVRAYAICEGVTYSSESSVQTVTYSTPKDLPNTWINGKSPHLFTVANGKQVCFSQGNLQYIGSAATPYWKFAEHQFDFLGDNGQGSDNQTVDRDLFGWGTSGWDNGNHYYQPYNTDRSTYPSTVGYGYGPWAENSFQHHLTGDYAEADWGVHNAIKNGGNIVGNWRTLTNDEWVYLINTRKDSNGNLLYGEGKVGNCIPGLIILPDDWTLPVGLKFTPGFANGYETNVYTFSEWAQMEAAGAVFLPAAGRRIDSGISDMGSIGRYWSSSYSEEGADALNFGFLRDRVNCKYSNYRYRGFSVRLVSDN